MTKPVVDFEIKEVFSHSETPVFTQGRRFEGRIMGIFSVTMTEVPDPTSRKSSKNLVTGEQEGTPAGFGARFSFSGTYIAPHKPRTLSDLELLFTNNLYIDREVYVFDELPFVACIDKQQEKYVRMTLQDVFVESWDEATKSGKLNIGNVLIQD